MFAYAPTFTPYSPHSQCIGMKSWVWGSSWVTRESRLDGISTCVELSAIASLPDLRTLRGRIYLLTVPEVLVPHSGEGMAELSSSLQGRSRDFSFDPLYSTKTLEMEPLP